MKSAYATGREENTVIIVLLFLLVKTTSFTKRFFAFIRDFSNFNLHEKVLFDISLAAKNSPYHFQLLYFVKQRVKSLYVITALCSFNVVWRNFNLSNYSKQSEF